MVLFRGSQLSFRVKDMLRTMVSHSTLRAASQQWVRRCSQLRVAVVGAGPAGFYCTKYLMQDIPKLKVDMFDRLPTPYGLVRTGVAPDHPEVLQQFFFNHFHHMWRR